MPVTIVGHRSFDEAIARARRTPITGHSMLDTRPGDGTPSDAELRGYLSDALAALELAETMPGVLSSAEHQLASLMQSRLAEHPDDITVTTRAAPGDGLEVRFDQGDLFGWFQSLFEWWRGIRPEPWLTAPDTPEPFGNGRRARVALLSDWGTGLYGAPVSAASIARDGGYDLLMHLGDVYYSGTRQEVQHRFLDVWPRVSGATSRALNSNHEMYTGGEGLFRLTLPEFGQAATYCALQTADWLLVGLDSAYADHDLYGRQVSWLEQLLERSGDRRVVLFSHHPPFSLFDRQGPVLVERLAQVLEARRVFAWYWGHEHRCVLYDRHPVWQVLGRSIGNGGYPAYRDRLGRYDRRDEVWRRVPGRNLVPGALVLDWPNSDVPGHEERYGAHGYVTLELDGPRLQEDVHLADGTVVRSERLT